MFLLAGLAGSASTLVSAQTLETHPVFEVGDKWTYRYHNTGDRKDPYLYTNQVYKSDAGSGWLYGESQEPNANNPQNIMRYDYKRADVKESFKFKASKPTKPGNRYANTQPTDDWIQFPLIVGKKYEIKFDWGNGEGHTKYDVEVEVFEKVKTEAGEFDAYRIKASGWWTRTSNGSGSGRAEYTLWFSPETKRQVKSDYFSRTPNGSTWDASNRELVKWEPQAELPAIFSDKAPTPVSAAAVPVAAASVAQ
jgi:hypothetical protein